MSGHHRESRRSSYESSSSRDMRSYDYTYQDDYRREEPRQSDRESYYGYDDRRRHSFDDDRRSGHNYHDDRRHHHDDRRTYHDDRDRRPHRDNNSSSSRDNHNRSVPPPSSSHHHHQQQASTSYYISNQPKDENLPPNTQNDPRGDDPSQRITKKASSRGAGRNTESFDPASTLVRPDVRVLIGNPNLPKFNKPMKHDDVVIVPELFGPEDNWDTYYQLVKELTDLQNAKVKGSDFISWHEGAHLICEAPQQSSKFQEIVAKLCDYFNIDAQSAGTRFNWYKDSSDWKPFHHDSAAFNPKRAKKQNITVGVSFGATRELAFVRAADETANTPKGPQPAQAPVRMYFPQTNNGVFTFGRDVNIRWKHGVNALPPAEQDGKGRISIVLWGLARDVIEEQGSPPILGADGQGPHANHNHRHNNKKRRFHNKNNNSNNNNGGNGSGDGRRRHK